MRKIIDHVVKYSSNEKKNKMNGPNHIFVYQVSLIIKIYFYPFFFVNKKEMGSKKGIMIYHHIQS